MNSLFPVLCIPRAFSNINETRIRKIFDQLQLGVINKVDIKCADKEGKFNRVFIHFKSWENNDNAKQAKLRLDEGKEIKIIYDEPWFWKVSAYRQYSKPAAFQQNKNQQNHKINQVKKPTIQFIAKQEVYMNQPPEVRPEIKPEPKVEEKKEVKVEEKKDVVVQSQTKSETETKTIPSAPTEVKKETAPVEKLSGEMILKEASYIYKETDVTSQKTWQFKKGALVTIIGQEGEWIEVRDSQKRRGFVKKDVLANKP